MVSRYTAGVMVVLIAAAAGCDRTRPGETASKSNPNVAAQAEKQMERAAAVIDDAAITAKIKTALIAEPGLKGLSIDVDTSQNIVSLSGNVASADLRKQAEQIARRVDGVKDVKNNLSIKPAT